MTTVTSNRTAQTRKSLAGQIDRLDTILDGLADGLNDAVAMAVKEAVELAVQQAVQGVLTEVLTNPEILAKLQSGLAKNAQPQVQAKPTLRDRMRQVLGGVGRKCTAALEEGRAGVQSAGNYLWSLWLKGWQKVTAVFGYARLLVHFRYQVLCALGVGLAIGGLGYLAGPKLASLVSGLAGFTTALAVQGLLWLRNTFSGLYSLGE